MTARRCPRCGGLVGADAEWCGQCLARLDGGEERSARREGGSPAGSAAPTARREAPGGEDASVRARGDEVVWACPTCGLEQPLEQTVCTACGTPFRRLFEEAERPAAAGRVSDRALVLSLAFPGAGHLASGRVGEGLARAVVFAYTLGTALAVVVARGGRGLGPFLPLVLLLVAAAVALYAFTVADARRLLRGEPQLLTTRMLLYGATGLMVLTVLVLVVSGMRVARF